MSLGQAQRMKRSASYKHKMQRALAFFMCSSDPLYNPRQGGDPAIIGRPKTSMVRIYWLLNPGKTLATSLSNKIQIIVRGCSSDFCD